MFAAGFYRRVGVSGRRSFAEADLGFNVLARLTSSSFGGARAIIDPAAYQVGCGTVAGMPELPEVETLCRQLNPRLVGARVLKVRSDPAAKYASSSRAAGSDVTALGRRGKYLIGSLSSGEELVLHLGMTGQLLWEHRPADHVRVRFELSSGTLWFRDPRRFGRAAVVPAGVYEAFPTLASLGPEPLSDEFTPRSLFAELGRPGPPVKVRLLAQRAVAGIGNYLADEVLHQARVHPQARWVTAVQAAALHAAIVDVVSRSIIAGGVSERDYVHVDGGRGRFASELVVYGRAGSPCVRCTAPLVRATVGGRSTTFCRFCQRLPQKR